MKTKNRDVFYKSKSKSKSKNKNSKQKSVRSKSKESPFDPVSYLNTHLDIKDLNVIPGKKKISTKRDLTSALSISTYAPDNTISFTKFRSKSSHQNYKKPNAVPPFKSLVSANLGMGSIITEEDNVQFTEVTPRGQQEVRPQTSIQLKRVKLRQQQAAIIIQRAWKNYQTLKMVRYYYKKYSRVSHPSVYKTTVNRDYRNNPDLQKTLKIKRNHAENQQQRQQATSFRQQIQNLDTVPINDYQNETNQFSSEQDIPQTPLSEISHQDNTNFQKQFVQKSIANNQKINKQSSSSQSLLSNTLSKEKQNSKIQKFISLFQQNRKNIERQFDKKIDSLFTSTKRIDRQSLEDDSRGSQNNDINLQQQSRVSYEPQIKVTDVQINSEIDSQNSENWYYQSVQPQFKIFQARLQIIKQKKDSYLQKIQKQIIQGKLDGQQGKRKNQKINAKYQNQKRKILKNKKNYQFSMSQLTKNAFSYHKQLSCLNKQNNQKYLPLRNCFSSQSVILKSILKQTQLKQYFSNFLQFQQEQKLSISKYSDDANHNNSFTYQQQNKNLSSDQPMIQYQYQLSSQSYSPQKDDLPDLLKQESNLEIKKQVNYDSIQQDIFSNLLNEIVHQIYLHERFYSLVRPYIEQIFEFAKVSDTQIFQFLNQLRDYFPIKDLLLKRMNQRINPSSLQILKIIRNSQYEVDQYQLILNEDVFKAYKKGVQKKFQNKKSIKLSKLQEISGDIDDLRMIQKLMDRRSQKRSKIQKYSIFQRDLFFMYMKAVFNSLNELIIQSKSYNTFMNTRSSIGPGQLTLAIKQYNKDCSKEEALNLINQSESKLRTIIKDKCNIPSFTNYQQLQLFQKQISKQIKIQMDESQFKWVNFMDQTLQIWQDICAGIQDLLFQQFVIQLQYY